MKYTRLGIYVPRKKKAKQKYVTKPTKKVDIVNIFLFGLLFIVLTLWLTSCTPIDTNAPSCISYDTIYVEHDQVDYVGDCCKCHGIRTNRQDFNWEELHYYCLNKTHTNFTTRVWLNLNSNRTNITYTNNCVNITVWEKGD
jgi:hypothetical protein